MPRPFIPVDQCAQVEMIYLLHGSSVENVFHVKKGSNYTLSDLEAVRDIVNVWHRDTYRDYQSVEAQLIRIRSKALHISTGALDDYLLPVPRAGLQGAVAYPNNVTFSFKKATSEVGRTRRGRWYLVGIPSNFYSGDNRDEMRADLVTNYATRLNALITQLATGGHTLVVVSYRENGAWRSSGKHTVVNSFVAVNNQYDSQRRRLAGRGV